MKKLAKLIMLFVILLACHPTFAQDLPDISGRAHIQDVGWTDVHSDENHHLIIGTMGQSRRIEAYSLQTSYPGVGIQYKSHVQDIGWQGDVSDGAQSGTTGQSKKIEALCIRLTGENAPNFRLYYRTHVENYGWLDWTTDYGASGTANHNFRAEAIEMVIYPADQPAPGPMTTPAIQATSRNEARHMFKVNEYRHAHGMNYVTGDANLKRIADARIAELPARFGHIRPNGKSYETIVKDLFPNYNGPAAIIENINLARTPLMTDPEYSFDYLSSYVHQLDIVLTPGARYMAWAATSTPRMGYSVEIFSGLDRVNFAD